jgi:hypothetical protein
VRVVGGDVVQASARGRAAARCRPRGSSAPTTNPPPETSSARRGAPNRCTPRRRRPLLQRRSRPSAPPERLHAPFSEYGFCTFEGSREPGRPSTRSRSTRRRGDDVPTPNHLSAGGVALTPATSHARGEIAARPGQPPAAFFSRFATTRRPGAAGAQEGGSGGPSPRGARPGGGFGPDDFPPLKRKTCPQRGCGPSFELNDGYTLATRCSTSL